MGRQVVEYGSMTDMPQFDEVLRQDYASGLRNALKQSNALIMYLPRRRRFWYKPWTWLRKNERGFPVDEYARHDARWSLNYGVQAGAIPVIYNELVPPGTAYLIDTERVWHGPEPSLIIFDELAPLDFDDVEARFKSYGELTWGRGSPKITLDEPEDEDQG